jgi:glycine/serine hydroxymethyltransferase
MKEEEMRVIAGWITGVLENPFNEKRLGEIRSMVESLCRQFPIYY